MIAYFNRVMNSAERNYCVIRHEFLPMVCAVDYLCGRHFLAHSDQGSLHWVMNFKNLEGQMGSC